MTSDSLPPGDDLKSHLRADCLVPVHRDQLRAERSVTGMVELLFIYVIYTAILAKIGNPCSYSGLV